MRVKRQALRQSAPAHQRDSGTPGLLQRQAQRFERLIAFQAGFHQRRGGGNQLEIQQPQNHGGESALAR